MALKDRIREARQARKMTQVALARAAGIKQPSLSELETGESKTISGDTLIAISQALKVRPEWLVTGHGPRELGAAAPAADPRDALSAREQIALYLFAGLVADQQRDVIERMRVTFETNQALARQMGGKPLRFVSNAAIEANFGSVKQLHQARKKYAAKRPKRESGTAMDDFLEDPE